MLSLNYDPFSVFAGSSTPVGLYARKRWLAEDSKSWERDFADTVNRLYEGQCEDGSWNGSIIESVRRLFGLHLTVRSANPSIERGLDWLAGLMKAKSGIQRACRNERPGLKALRGLPFVPGGLFHLVMGSGLFLSTIFGRENSPFILECYAALEKRGVKDCGGWGGLASSNNILRAFVVHPEYSRKDAVLAAVKALAGLQKPEGSWPRPISLHQAVNALAHLDSSEADFILEKALRYLANHQNSDGTWGREDREWKTFLTVHAMKRKGLL